MSLQRYLALYRGHYGSEMVLTFTEDHERLYERLSEPQRVTFKPRIPAPVHEQACAIDAKIEASRQRHIAEVTELQKQRRDLLSQSASPATEAASTAPDVAGSGMAPAPESLPTPVAGGPSTCDKFVGVDRVFCAVCERQEHEHPSSPNYDGAPYCSYGHRTRAECDCGPIAEND